MRNSVLAVPLATHTALLGIVAAALLVGILVSVGIRMTVYPPPYHELLEMIRLGHTQSTFLPLAYPLFLSLPFRYFGMRGVEVWQIGLHVALAVTAFLLMKRFRASNWLAMLGGLLVAFNPDLATGVTKVFDTPFSVELLLLTLLLSLSLAVDGNRIRETPAGLLLVLLSVVFAAGVSTRPNFVFLLPVVLYAVAQRKKLWAARVLVFGALTVAVFVALALAEHGSYFFPRNGPYNLYAGQNHLSLYFLEKDMNAEFSLAPAYRDATGSFPSNYTGDQVVFRDPSYEPFFTRESIAFARTHPVEELKLVGYKLYTLFRPGTKSHTLLSFSGLFKIFLALPVFVYLGLLLSGRRDRSDLYVLAFVILYVTPFLISNSDPRFRVPLDVILVLSIVKLAAARLTLAQAAPGLPEAGARPIAA